MGNVERKGIGMADDRRNFIKRFGITLGSLIVSGSLPGCATENQIKKRSDPPPTPRGPEWEALRQSWLDLSDQRTRDALSNDFWSALRQDGDFATARSRLGKKHHGILDRMVARGQLEKTVAEHMQVAFEEAAFHIVRSRATCYMMIPVEYAPRENLLQQTEALRGVSSDLDPATVAKAQAAIAQDVAFFEIFEAGKSRYDQSLADKYKAGNLEASPEALEAARLLTLLFVEPSD